METIDIKEEIKQALNDYFSKDNLYLRNIISDIMEEIAIGKAIEKGDNSEFVDETEIFKALQKGGS